MKGTSKRLLSLLLVFCMLFSMMPVSVFATDTGADENTTVETEQVTQLVLGGEGDQSGEGWTWSASENTLTLSGANLTNTVITLPEYPTIEVVSGTENIIEVVDNVPITASGGLQITGDGKLTINSLSSDPENVAPQHTISGVETISVQGTSLFTYGYAGLAARNVVIMNAEVEIVGYGYGINYEGTSGSASVVLDNVSGSIVGELDCGIELFMEYNDGNSIDQKDAIGVEIVDCEDLVIKGEPEREQSSGNGHRSAIWVRTRDAETDAYLKISNSSVELNGSGGGINVNSHSDNSAGDDASAAWVEITGSDVAISTITNTWAAIFVNNNGTGELATASIDIEDSTIKALCPNDVAIMTSTKNAASEITVSDSTVEMSGAYAGIRAKAISSDAAEATVSNSVLVVTDGIADNYNVIDEMDNGNSSDGTSGITESTVIVPVGGTEITANEDGTWTVPAGGTISVNGKEIVCEENTAINADGTVDAGSKELIINNVEGLLAFAAAVNAGDNFAGKVVKLGANIDLKGIEWAPIGGENVYFAGEFDGQSNTISNLTQTQGARMGLFGLVEKAYIHDLVLEDVSFTVDETNARVGALAGNLQYWNVIEDVTIDGIQITVNGNDGLVGSVAGYVWKSQLDNVDVKNAVFTVNGTGNVIGGHTAYGRAHVWDTNVTANNEHWLDDTVQMIDNTDDGVDNPVEYVLQNYWENCDVNGVTIKLNGTGSEAGGFFGSDTYNNHSNYFVNCHVTGLDVQCAQGTSQTVGGFIAWNNGTTAAGTVQGFEGCSASGTIAGADGIYGGFVGQVGGRACSYDGASADVDITCTGVAGGFVGCTNQYFTHAYTFTDCEATGDVSGTVAGGFAGKNGLGGDGDNLNVTYTDCTASGAVSGTEIAGGFLGEVNTELPATNWSTVEGTGSLTLVGNTASTSVTVSEGGYNGALIGYMDCVANVDAKEGNTVKVTLVNNTPNTGYNASEDTVEDDIQILTYVTGDITGDMVWNDGDIVGPVTIKGGTAEDPIEITVNGTVTVAGTIRLSPDTISNVVFNAGTNGGKLIRSAGFTGQMFYAEGVSGNFQTMSFNGITLDGGAVWTGDVDKTLNRGTTNEGVKATGSVLYLAYANATLTNSTLQNHDDSTGEKANAVFLRYYSTIEFNNSVVKNNNSISTYYRGGVVTIRQGGTVITNNADVYGNSGAAGGFMGISSTGAYGGVAKVYNSKFHNNYSDNGAVFLMQCNSKRGYLLVDGCEFYDNASKTAVLTEWAYSRPFIIKDSYFHDNECAVWDCHSDPVLDISGKFVVAEDADYTKYLFETPLALGGALTEGASIAMSEASITKLMATGYIVSGTKEYKLTEADLTKFVLPEGYWLEIVDANGDGINDAVAVKDPSHVDVTVYDNFPGSTASETQSLPTSVKVLPALNFAHEGFAFAGWTTSADGTETIKPQMFTETATLYAQWGLEVPVVTLSRVDAVLTATVTNMYEGVTYTYQWYMDNVAIEGAAQSSYTMTDVNSHSYKCEVTASKEGFASAIGSASGTSSAPATAQIGDAKYATLAEAVTAANAIEGGAAIDLLKDVTLAEKLTISGNVTIQGECTITRGDAYTGTLFAVNAGASLTLDGGLTVDGGNNWAMDMDLYNADLRAMVSIPQDASAKYFTPEEGAPVAAAYVITLAKGTSEEDPGAAVVLNDVTFQNNYSTNSGIVYAEQYASATLDGAQVKHCANVNNSGLVVNASGAGIKVTMNDGTVIDGNHVGGNHGVFKIYSGTVFTMNGGEVTNTTGWNSNGVVVGLYGGTFIMNDGLICSNSSVYGPSNGRNAAIYLHSNSVMEMNGGKICHNTGRSRGGIDSSRTTSKLTITGGYVVDNVSLAGNSTADVGGTVGTWAISGGEFTQDVSKWLVPDSGLAYDEATGTYAVTDHVYNLYFRDPATGEQAVDVGPLKGNNAASLVKTGKLFYADYYEMELEVLSDVKIDETIVIDYPMTVNLNGHTVYATGEINPAFRILADVTVTGEGGVDGATYGDAYSFIVGNNEGTKGSLTIKNGTYYGQTTVASVTKGTLTVESGEFKVDPYVASEGAEPNYTYLLNCIDASYKDGSAKIEVKGGTFHEFNPADNAAEGTGTNFVAKGCESTETEENVWTVSELCLAELTFKVNGEEKSVVYNGADGQTLQDLIGTNDYADFGETSAQWLLAYAANAASGADKLTDVVLTLYADLDEPLVLPNKYYQVAADYDITIDLNDFKLTNTTSKKTIETYVDTTIQNGTVSNGISSGRAVDTRADLDLVLTDVTLSADKTSAQALTIGGDVGEGNRASVTMTNSNISAMNGYGVIVYNPVDMTLTDSVVTAYGALYFKAANNSQGSAGSVVNATDSELNSMNLYSGESNGFATVVFEDNNVTLNVTGGQLSAVGGIMGADAKQDVLSLGVVGGTNTDDAVAVTGTKVNLSANTTVYYSDNAGILSGNEKGNTITMADDYADILKNQSRYTKDNGDGTVTVISYVEWIQDELLAGRDVVLEQDIVVTTEYVESIPAKSNGNGKYNEAHGNGAVFNVVGEDVIFDLNGHKITYTGHDDYSCNKRNVSVFYVTDAGTLNIVDNSEAKTGAVDVYGMATAVYSVATNSKAIINGGTWTWYPCVEPTCGTTNIFMYASHGGELYINGGTFDNQANSEYMILEYGSTKETTDNNGSGVDYDETKVEISGGTFIGTNPGAIKYLDVSGSQPETTVDGCADGYKAVNNGNGTYGVEPNMIVKLHLTDPTTGEPATIPYLESNSVSEVVKTGKAFYADYYVMTLELQDNVVIDETIVIDYPMTIDLNSYTLTSADGINPAIRIVDGADVTVKNGSIDASGYAFILGASDGSSAGNLTIKGGSYKGGTSVASVTKGTLTIEGGKFEVEPYEGNYNFLINCIDANYKDGSAVIEVKGGTFHNFDPANNAAEGAGTSFVAEGYLSAETETGSNIWTVEPNMIFEMHLTDPATGEAHWLSPMSSNDIHSIIETCRIWYESLQGTYDFTLKILDNVVIDETIVIDYPMTIDLNSYTLTSADGINPAIRIVDGADVTVKNGSIDASGYAFILGASDGSSAGNLTIESGSYTGRITVASVTKGTLTVEGGEFAVTESQYGATYLLNCIDANYKDGSAKIVVKGGTFHNFDPANNAAEGAGTSFVAEGYESTGTDNVWTVEEIVAAKIGEVPYKTLAKAIAAVQNGETIVLLKNNAEDVTITQKAGLSFTIDGSDKTYTGTISINGGKRSTGAETLTIQNVNFVAEGQGQSSIVAESGTYAHNVTVDNCIFTGNDAKQAYGISLRNAYNITVKNTTGTKLLDLVYSAKAVTGFTAEKVTVTDSINGFYLSYVMKASFKGLELDVSNIGVYVNNYNASSATFENCAIEAPTPVMLQQKNETKAYSLTFNGTNTFTATSESGNWLNVQGSDASFKVIVNDAGLDMTKTSGLVANDGNVYYNNLQNAVNADEDGAITLWADGQSATVSKEMTITKNDFTATITAGEGFVVKDTTEAYVVMESNPVAQIGEVPYETLAEAIAAVQNGETIVLLKGNAENVTITQEAGLSFTINGSGKTYTGTISINGDKRSTGAETLTIQNVNFVAEGQWQSSISAVKNTYVHNVTVDNCTFTGTDAKQAYGIYLRHSYNITVKNTTGTKLYDLVYGNTAVTGFAAENVTVTDSGMGIFLPYGMNASFKNVNLEVSSVGIGFYNYNASSATFENCTIKAETAVWLEQKNETKAYSLTFNGTNTFTAASESGNWLNVLGSDASFKVIVNDAGLDMTKTSGLVANDGNVYYNKLQNAVNEDEDGAITLWADGQSATVSKEMTITKNGFTATITAGEGFVVEDTAEAYVVAEKVVEVVKYKFGQSVQIGLIEPWFLKANVRVYNDQYQTNIPYENLNDYGAYFIRASQLDDPDATQDTLTVEDIVDNASVVHYAKSMGTAEIDGSYITASFDEGIYTYELSDSVFVLFYIVDGEDTYYAPIRERNLKELLDARKNDKLGFPNELERDVYSAMSNLESSITEYRAQFDEIEDMAMQDAPTLAEYVAANGEFTAETVKNYNFGNSVQIILIEPWGLKVNARAYNSANPTCIDYNAVEDYGVIVYYDADGSIDPSAMTAEMLMTKEDAYVFSSSNGDAFVDGSYMSAIYNKDIFTYMLNSNAYVMFYVKDADGYHYGDVKVRNIYELAGTRSQDTTGAFGELEKAVYGDMVNVYDAVTAYRKDYFENN